MSLFSSVQPMVARAQASTKSTHSHQSNPTLGVGYLGQRLSRPDNRGWLQKRRAESRRQRIAAISALSLVVTMLSAIQAPPAAAVTYASGADLQISKQAGVLDANGNCVTAGPFNNSNGAVPQDAHGFVTGNAGDTRCWTITVHNNGPDAAQNVSISDSFQGQYVNGWLGEDGANPHFSITNSAGQDVTSANGGTCPSYNNPNQYNHTGNMYNCTANSIPAGGTATMMVIGTIDPGTPNSNTGCQGVSPNNLDAPGQTFDGSANWLCGDNSWIINNSSVTAANDPDSSNNQVQTWVGVGTPDTPAAPPAPPTADVAVTKQVTGGTNANGQLTAGGSVAWQVTAQNNGPADAPNVTVTEHIPAGVINWTATPSRGTCTPASGSTGGVDITCTIASSSIGALPAPSATGAGGTANITIHGTLANDATGNIVNTATSTTTDSNGNDMDPTPDNNTGTVTTPVTQNALNIAKNASRTTLPSTAGIDFSYTITISNPGPSVSQPTTVTESMPSGVEFVSGSGNMASQSPPTWSIPALQPGAAYVITVDVRSTADLTTAGNVTNTATLGTQPDGSQPSADYTLSGDPQADLLITKGGPATVVAGSTGTFTLGVSNAELDDQSVVAIAPLVQDTLPAGVTFVSGPTTVTGSSGTVFPVTCTADGQVVSCQIGTPGGPSGNMNQGEEVSIPLNVQFGSNIANGTVLTNSATVQNTSDGFTAGSLGSGSLLDPNLANNTATWQTTVTASSDLVAQSFNVGTGQCLAPGSTQPVTIEIGNNGPQTATGVSFDVQRGVDAQADLSNVQVTLAGVTWTVPASACSANPREVHCNLVDSNGNPLSIPSGEVATVTYPLTISTGATPGEHTDSVTVSSDNSVAPDSDTSNNTVNTDSVNVCYPTAPQLNLTKSTNSFGLYNTDGHPMFIAGTNFGYMMSVQSPADQYVADAQNVIVTDPLPVGLVPVSASIAGSNAATGVNQTIPAAGACTINGPTTGTTTNAAGGTVTGPQYTVVCNLGTVEGSTLQQQGAPALINVFGTFAANVTNDDGSTTVGGVDQNANSNPNLYIGNLGEQVINSSTVAWQGLDADGNLNPDVQTTSGSSTVDIVSQADLALTKTATPTTGDPGDPVSWTMVITNNGPSTSLAPFTTDSLANSNQITGLAISQVASSDSDTNPTCTLADDGSVNCSATTLSVGGTITISLTGNIAQGLPGGTQIVNTATVNSSTTDPNPNNNSDTATITVLPVADLSVTKSASPTTVEAGDTVTWTVVLTNSGPSTATNPVLTDTFANPAWVSDLAVAGIDGSGAANPQCSIADDGSVACTADSLDSGGTITVTITGTVGSNIPGGTTIENSATGTSDTPDTDLSDNTDTATVTVSPRADLSVVKTADPSSGRNGDTITWTAVLTNQGPDTATNPVLTDAFASSGQVSGVTVVSALSSDGNTVTCTGSVSCTAPSLSNGGTITVTLTGTIAVDGAADGSTTIDNTATVSSDTTDHDSSNNTDTATVDVLPPLPADLQVVKTATPSQAEQGDTVTWTVVLLNQGPGVALNPVLTDTFDNSTQVSSVQIVSAVSSDSGDLLSAGQCVVPPSLATPVAPQPDPAPIPPTAPGYPDTDDDSDSDLDTDDSDILDDSDASDDSNDSDESQDSDGDGSEAGSDSDDVDADTDVDADDQDKDENGSDESDKSQDADDATSDDEEGSLDSAPEETEKDSESDDADSSEYADGSGVESGYPSNPEYDAMSAPVYLEPDFGSARTAPAGALTFAMLDSIQYLPMQMVLTEPITVDLFGGTDPNPVANSDVSVTEGTDNSATDLPTAAATSAAIVCQDGTLSPGGTITVTLNGVISGALPGDTVVNTATGTSDTPGTPGTDTATVNVVDTPVFVSPDELGVLTLTKTAAPTVAQPGDTITWSILVTNIGQGTAINPTVSDALADPSQVTGVTVVSAVSSDGLPVTCDGTVTCSSATLSPDGTIVITLTGQLADGLAGGTTVPNTATVTADHAAVPPAATAEVTVPEQHANLVVTKTATPAKVTPGSQVTWTVVLTNTGPDAALNPKLTDTLADGSLVTGKTVTSVTSSDTGNNPSCVIAGSGVLTCTADQLSNGGTITVTMTGQVAANAADGQVIANSATGTSSTPGTDGTDTATVTVLVPKQIAANNSADLRVVKVAGQAQAPAGAQVSWTVKMSNSGPAAALDANISDTLDNATQGTLLSAAIIANDGAVNPSCTVSGAQVTCAMNSLASGGSITVQVTGQLAANLAPGTRVGNTVVVAASSFTPDNDLSNNTAAASILVPELPATPMPLAITGARQLTTTGTSYALLVVAVGALALGVLLTTRGGRRAAHAAVRPTKSMR